MNGEPALPEVLKCSIWNLSAVQIPVDSVNNKAYK